MSRYPAERHNDEFRKLFDRFRVDNGEPVCPVGLAHIRVSELLGVSVDTVKQWLKPTHQQKRNGVSEVSVDAFKVALGIKLADLDDSQRARVMEILRGTEGGRI